MEQIRITIQEKIRLFRTLKRFKYVVRVSLIILFTLGMWVATRTLKIEADINHLDKIIHLVVFFGFAFIIDLATSRKPFWLWKGLPLLVYGMGIEVLQYYTPDRSFSMMDWFADCTGVAVYLILKKLIIRL